MPEIATIRADEIDLFDALDESGHVVLIVAFTSSNPGFVEIGLGRLVEYEDGLKGSGPAAEGYDAHRVFPIGEQVRVIRGVTPPVAR